MCASGFCSRPSSIELSRTLVCSDSGHPPPKRFDPQREQNVFPDPSSGWYVVSSSRPSLTSIHSVRALPFAVPTPPEIRLHEVQWQNESVMNGSATSKRTPPHQQLPRITLVVRLAPALQLLPEGLEEATGQRAVHEPMVVREGEVHDRADRDHVLPELVGHDPRALDKGVGAEDRRLRLADHRRSMEGAVATRVGDRERPALHLVRRELLVAGALGDVRDGPGHPEQVEALGVLDDRDDQALALGQLDREAEVDVVPRDDLVAADLAVDPRVVAERDDDGA